MQREVKFITCGMLVGNCAIFDSTKNYQRRGRSTTLLFFFQKESEYLSGNLGKFEVTGHRDMIYVKATQLPRLICYVLHFKKQYND